MPSSPCLSREVKVEEKSCKLEEMQVQAGKVKIEEGAAEGNGNQIVNLEFEETKPAAKMRRLPSRSSTRIATIASRQPVMDEVPDSPPTSPVRVRKTLKTKMKTTKKVIVQEEVEEPPLGPLSEVRARKTVKTKTTKKVTFHESTVEKINLEGKKAKKSARVESLAGTEVADDVEDLGELDTGPGETDLGARLAKQLAERADVAEPLKIKATVRIFNFVYLEAIQEEDKRVAEILRTYVSGPKPSKRPDLKAINKMLQVGAVLNPEKRIGSISGVTVGQQFLSRAEMVVIGLHSHWLNGIDYIGKSAKDKDPKLVYPLTCAIVMSGGYEDDVDNSEEMVYTGQGGNNLTGDRRQIADQKMIKGNLALKNSIICKTPVRVIRGHLDKLSYTGKVYTYDGLYEVVDHWPEVGISGYRVFKYKLRRLPGQPVLTSKQVQFAGGKVPTTVADLRGLVCKDISNGQERIPVPASNTVDDPPVPPSDYTYITKSIIPDDIPKPLPAKGCKCKGACTDEQNCACAQKNGGSFPYVFNHGGRLKKPMDVVYECGPGCGCGPECLNRTSQIGLQYRLEVYKTVSKGWACRSWDFIPAGAPICEYFGVLRKNDENLESMLDNSYIFELDLTQTMQGMEGRQKRFGDNPPEISDEHDLMRDAPAHVLDAGRNGSVSRFLNHSCEPNVFIQCILSHHHDVTQPRILMFAADNIHPLEELCYDYGYMMDSVVLADGSIKEMPCYCGAPSCRKRMY